MTMAKRRFMSISLHRSGEDVSESKDIRKSGLKSTGGVSMSDDAAEQETTVVAEAPGGARPLGGARSPRRRCRPGAAGLVLEARATVGHHGRIAHSSSSTRFSI